MKGSWKRCLQNLLRRSQKLQKQSAQKEEKYTKDAVHHVVRIMMLQIIDTLWMEHLDMMEHLRSSVNLRAYGQRDPLVEYKKEGLRAFKSLEATLKNELIFSLKISMDSLRHSKRQAKFCTDYSKNIEEEEGSGKIGRNDPCPCGSGKKWKKCGELNTEEHQANMAKMAA
jgi:preprotein translocase subunit SecA